MIGIYMEEYMRVKEPWDEWAIFDDDGLIGIRDDAPKRSKRHFLNTWIQ